MQFLIVDLIPYSVTAVSINYKVLGVFCLLLFCFVVSLFGLWFLIICCRCCFQPVFHIITQDFIFVHPLFMVVMRFWSCQSNIHILLRLLCYLVDCLHLYLLEGLSVSNLLTLCYVLSSSYHRKEVGVQIIRNPFIEYQFKLSGPRHIEEI